MTLGEAPEDFPFSLHNMAGAGYGMQKALWVVSRRGGQHSHGEAMHESEVNDLGLAGLIGLGATLGVMHVLSGPDHMSAIAQLSCGKRLKGFWLGAKWGVGHSSGLLLMYAIFMASGERLNLDEVGQHFDTVVGAVMIVLGLYGLAQAFHLKRREGDGKLGEREDAADAPAPGLGGPEKIAKAEACRDTDEAASGVGDEAASRDSASQGDVELAVHHERIVVVGHAMGVPGGGVWGADNGALEHREQVCLAAAPPVQGAKEGSCRLMGLAKPDFEVAGAEHAGQRHPGASLAGAEKEGQGVCARLRQSSHNVLAVMVGILHGIAGPGGVLGVLPAVSLKDPAQSAAYLSAFCVFSVLVMAIFAACWGEITGTS